MYVGFIILFLIIVIFYFKLILWKKDFLVGTHSQNVFHLDSLKHEKGRNLAFSQIKYIYLIIIDNNQ